MNKKIFIVVRGLPGSGKSTKVNALLNKHKASVHGHVFSADRWFHPKSTAFDLLDLNALTLEEQVEAANNILMLWYDCKYSKQKAEVEPQFLEFKKLFDKGQYKEALEIAKSMIKSLHDVEYQHQWAAYKVPQAHKAINASFKAAVDAGITPVISDNCNCSLRDMASCVQYAKDNDYEIIIEEPESDHWKQHKDLLADKYKNRDKLSEFAKVLGEKNAHGVPSSTIEKMMAKWVHKPKIDDILDKKFQ